MELTNDLIVADIYGALKTVVEEASDVTVMTLTDVEHASLLIKGIGKLSKKAEARRKEIVEPLNEEVKSVNAFFKKLFTEVVIQEARLKDELLQFDRRQEALHRQKVEEENRKLREEMKAQEEARQKAKAEGQETVPEFAPIIVETVSVAPKLSDSNSFGVSTSRTKIWRVIDLSKVPLEFLTVDEKKVDSIRKGYDFEEVSPIEGIEFYVEKSIRR